MLRIFPPPHFAARRGKSLPLRGPGTLALTLIGLGHSVPTPGRPVPKLGASGRIEGIASIATSLTTPRARVRVYEEPGSAPARPRREENPLANVVIYLEPTPALRNAAVREMAHRLPEVRQRGEHFVPHVLPVLVGTTVGFPNDDPIFHNVFSLSSIKSFDLGRYPRGSSRTVTFSRAGIVPVFCHIHADMNGFILVLDTPFFVSPDANGHFVIEGVPPGDYRLITWHERIRPMQAAVHIEAGGTTTLQLRIPLPERSGEP
ncbi:MAG TPA: hypothetical protein VGP61_09940 [Gemmatimonadales bacterium]|nr:hypothetical protein [Gemmatimonadales bacterium]